MTNINKTNDTELMDIFQRITIVLVEGGIKPFMDGNSLGYEDEREFYLDDVFSDSVYEPTLETTPENLIPYMEDALDTYADLYYRYTHKWADCKYTNFYVEVERVNNDTLEEFNATFHISEFYN